MVTFCGEGHFIPRRCTQRIALHPLAKRGEGDTCRSPSWSLRASIIQHESSNRYPVSAFFMLFVLFVVRFQISDTHKNPCKTLEVQGKKLLSGIEPSPSFPCSFGGNPSCTKLLDSRQEHAGMTDGRIGRTIISCHASELMPMREGWNPEATPGPPAPRLRPAGTGFAGVTLHHRMLVYVQPPAMNSLHRNNNIALAQEPWTDLRRLYRERKS